MTFVIKNAAYTNGVRDCGELLEIFQQG